MSTFSLRRALRVQISVASPLSLYYDVEIRIINNVIPTNAVHKRIIIIIIRLGEFRETVIAVKGSRFRVRVFG